MYEFRRPGRAPRPSRLCIALLAAGLATAIPTVMAQSSTAGPAAVQHFDIPDQPLDDALRAYMRQSGVQVVYPSTLAKGVISQPVSGTLSADEALARLLRGSGLSVRRVSADAVTLEVAAAGQTGGVIVTDTLSVAGDRVQGGAASDEARLLDSYRSVGSTTSIGRVALERFRGTSNGDIVKGVAGVTAGDPRVGNGFDVNIRGIQGQSRVPVIIDGGQSSMDTYRGYAGQSQRTYLDPDLISRLTITKGPSLQANASGGIGGVVEMETLNVDDVLREGRDVGVRVRGGLANGSANNLPGYEAAPRSDRSATGSQFFNVAAAGHWD
ncbi:heme-binding protein, partial [Stenotrophomonas sp. HMWF022]